MKLEEAMKRVTPNREWGITQGVIAPEILEALRDHWYNVGPKLLEALDRLSSISDTEFDKIQPIIAEAKEVKGI